MQSVYSTAPSNWSRKCQIISNIYPFRQQTKTFESLNLFSNIRWNISLQISQFSKNKIHITIIKKKNTVCACVCVCVCVDSPDIESIVIANLIPFSPMPSLGLMNVEARNWFLPSTIVYVYAVQTKNIYALSTILNTLFYHHHHHLLLARISLTLSLSLFLSLSLSPSVSIIHCFQKVFQATTDVRTELLQISSSLSSDTYMSTWRGPKENVAYEFILTLPAVSHMSCSSISDGFRDGW